jgi:hypothetical protein
MKLIFIYFLTWSAAAIGFNSSQQQQGQQQPENEKITLEELREIKQ